MSETGELRGCTQAEGESVFRFRERGRAAEALADAAQALRDNDVKTARDLHDEAGDRLRRLEEGL